jgi:hypothetical protein
MPAAFYLQEDFWYSFLFDVESTSGVIVQLEGLGQLKNPVTSSGTETATFWLATVSQPIVLPCAAIYMFNI